MVEGVGQTLGSVRLVDGQLKPGGRTDGRMATGDDDVEFGRQPVQDVGHRFHQGVLPVVNFVERVEQDERLATTDV